MTETQQAQTGSHSAGSHSAPGAADAKSATKIHRVCIGCNNMFEVTMDNYEAKHCPACHKA